MRALRARVPQADLEAAGLVGRSERSGDPYDRFRNRLMFPIHNAAGRLVGFGGRTLGDDRAKYVNTAETDRFHKGSLLYGLHLAKREIRETGRAVLVRGLLRRHRRRSPAAVEGAVAGMGTALTPEQARLLARYTEEVVVGLRRRQRRRGGLPPRPAAAARREARGAPGPLRRRARSRLAAPGRRRGGGRAAAIDGATDGVTPRDRAPDPRRTPRASRAARPRPRPRSASSSARCPTRSSATATPGWPPSGWGSPARCWPGGSAAGSRAERSPTGAARPTPAAAAKRRPAAP